MKLTSIVGLVITLSVIFSISLIHVVLHRLVARGDAIEFVDPVDWSIPHSGRYSTYGNPRTTIAYGKLHYYVFFMDYEHIPNLPPLKSESSLLGILKWLV